MITALSGAGESKINLSNLALFGSGSTGIDINDIGNVAGSQGGATINITSAQIGGGVGLAGGPTGTGVVISAIGGSTANDSNITLQNVDIDLQGASATGLAIGNVISKTASKSTITSLSSNITTASLTVPAISIDNADTINLNFTSVESGVPKQVLPNLAAPYAISIDATASLQAIYPGSISVGPPLDPLTFTAGDGTSTGEIDISGNFTVERSRQHPTSGDQNDILNNSNEPVTVRVSGAQLSPPN